MTRNKDGNSERERKKEKKKIRKMGEDKEKNRQSMRHSCYGIWRAGARAFL